MPEETLQPLDEPTLTRPGLLVMDVDATLIDEEVIDLLGDAAGVGDRVAQITARAMAGELDFAEALRARVALLQGLPASVFARTRAAACANTPHGTITSGTICGVCASRSNKRGCGSNRRARVATSSIIYTRRR